MHTAKGTTRFSSFVFIALAGGLLLSACGPAPLPRDQVQKELGDFMLDFVAKTDSSKSTHYTLTAPQPWAGTPYEAHLIVWGPAKDQVENTPVDYVNTDAPYQVWSLLDGKLTPVADDKVAAIADFRQTHMNRPQSAPPPATWGWGYTEFAILKLSDGNRKARVYVGLSCGPLCGNGTIYTLERNAAGQWEIKNAEGVWIS